MYSVCLVTKAALDSSMMNLSSFGLLIIYTHVYKLAYGGGVGMYTNQAVLSLLGLSVFLAFSLFSYLLTSIWPFHLSVYLVCYSDCL